MLAETCERRLAALAGNTVVAAATTDAWEAARRKFARLLGRGDPEAGTTGGSQRLEGDTPAAHRGGLGAGPRRAGGPVGEAWQTCWRTAPDAEADLRALGAGASRPALRPRQCPLRITRPGGRAGHEHRGIRWRDRRRGVFTGTSGPARRPYGSPGSGGRRSRARASGDLRGRVGRSQPRRDCYRHGDGRPARMSAVLPVSLPPRPTLLAGRDDLLTALTPGLYGDDRPGRAS